jgi:phosphatidate cytidylyltransferase
MKRVLTAVVLIPLVLLVVFKASLWLFSVVVGVIVVVCLHEYLAIVERYGIKPVRWAAYIVSILLIVGTFVFTSVQNHPHEGTDHLWSESIPYWAPLLLVSLVFGIPAVFRNDLRMALAASATSAFGVLYVALPLALLISMRWIPGYKFLVVFVLLSVWAGDITAYYVGKNLGRHKLAPVVSPNKTWEGAIASLVTSAIVAGLIFHFAPTINRLFRPFASDWFSPSPSDESFPYRFYPSGGPSSIVVYTLGIIANIAAQFGDLFESAIKRGAQMKDSGSLLPGHGGVLDRIDALLFAIPVVWYYAALNGFLGPGFSSP